MGFMSETEDVSYNDLLNDSKPRVLNDANTNDNIDTVEKPIVKYANELNSWLDFNGRVLFEAKRSNNPILERLSFVGIADNNLDEFIRTRFKSGKSIKDKLRQQTNDLENIYDELLVELREKYSINITNIDHIRENKKAYKWLKMEFKKNIFPLIQPLVLKDELPIPEMQDGGTFLISKFDNDDPRGITCIIKVPDTKLIKVKYMNDYDQTFITQEEIIEEFISSFYRGVNIVWSKLFRVFRKIESLYIDTNANYLGTIKDELTKRAKAEIIMVDIVNDITALETIVGNAKKRKRRYIGGLKFLIDIKDIVEYTDDMVFDKAKPRTPLSMIGDDIFQIISAGDILVHFPYESFELSTVRFITEAAKDPNVVAIKQTLYRVSADSAITKALIEAAKSGKQVTVLLELKAKMDEWNNLKWADELKSAGCDIIFGPVDMKTHAKVTLVIRREGDHLVKYANIATGNFNDKTAKVYEDLSYFCKERKRYRVGDDLCELFNHLGGYSSSVNTNELLVSPVNFRSTIESEIDECIKYGKGSSIIMKTNSFTDKDMCDKLYEASNAGVNITLIVRGTCILIPGLLGISENIKVISIVGRYLEHSRIYRFKHDSVEKMYIGSGDMMPRNLDRRIEVIAPIKQEQIKLHIDELLNEYCRDNTNAHILQPDGTYIEPNIEINDNSFSVQNFLIKKYKKIEKTIIK